MQQLITLFENDSPSGERWAAPESVTDTPVAQTYRYGIDLEGVTVTLRETVGAGSGCGTSAACNDDIQDYATAFAVETY